MNQDFVRKKFFYLQCFIYLILFSGCAPYKHPVSDYVKFPHLALTAEETRYFEESQQKAASHWLYRIIPRHRSQIYWYDLGHWLAWACFGNDEHGLFGEAHLPLFNPQQSIGIGKAFAWTLRNPLHNFCYYVIGSAGRINDEFTILKMNRKSIQTFQYSPVAKTVFGGRFTSFYFGVHNYKPLISIRLAYGSCWKSDFYIGWRDQGNFGIKFLPLTKVSLAVWENLSYTD